jgi:hypothetical protein
VYNQPLAVVLHRWHVPCSIAGKPLSLLWNEAMNREAGVRGRQEAAGNDF